MKNKTVRVIIVVFLLGVSALSFWWTRELPKEDVSDKGSSNARSNTKQEQAVDGVVMRPDSTPLPNCLVVLSSQTGGTTVNTIASQEGRFLFSGVRAGLYSIQAEHPVWGQVRQSLVVDARTVNQELVYTARGVVDVEVDYPHKERLQDVAQTNVIRMALKGHANVPEKVTSGHRIETARFETVWPGEYELIAESAATNVVRSIIVRKNGDAVQVKLAADDLVNGESIEKELRLRVSVNDHPYTGPIRIAIAFAAGLRQEYGSTVVTREIAVDGAVATDVGCRLVPGCVISVDDVKGFPAALVTVPTEVFADDVIDVKFDSRGSEWLELRSVDTQLSWVSVLVSSSKCTVDRCASEVGLVSLSHFEHGDEVAIDLSTVLLGEDLAFKPNRLQTSTMIDTTQHPAATTQFSLQDNYVIVRPMLPASSSSDHKFGKLFLRFLDCKIPKWSDAVLFDAGSSVIVEGLPDSGRVEVLVSCWSDYRRWERERGKSWARFVEFAPVACQTTFSMGNLRRGSIIEVDLIPPTAAGAMPIVTNSKGEEASWCYLVTDPRRACGSSRQAPWKWQATESYTSHLTNLAFGQYFGERFARFYAFCPEEYTVITDLGCGKLDQTDLASRTPLTVTRKRTLSVDLDRINSRIGAEGALHCRSGLVLRSFLQAGKISGNVFDKLVFVVPESETPEELVVSFDGKTYSYRRPEIGAEMTLQDLVGN